MSIWRAVRFHFFLSLWDFCFVFFSLPVVFSCSVLRMGVEKCNWALCKTPNCLTSNTNSVLWLPVVCEGGCTRSMRKREQTFSSFLAFFVASSCQEAWLECNRYNKVSPLWAHVLPCISAFLSCEIWPFGYDLDSQSLLTHVEQQTTLLHSLPSKKILFWLNGHMVLSCLPPWWWP